MRVVDVVPADCDHRKSKAPHIRHHQHLSGLMAGSVRARRRRHAVLQQIIIVRSRLAVYLVGAHADESLDLDRRMIRALQEDMRPEHVVDREGQRVAEAQVHVRLDREVEDRIELLGLQRIEHVRVAADVAVDKSEVGVGVQHPGVVR